MPTSTQTKTSTVSNKLGARLKSLRKELGLSQEAIGAQGFVSTPGWIKIENGQRQASEKLIGAITDWLVADKYMRRNHADTLRKELLTAKYLDARSPFVREMANAHARSDATLAHLLKLSDAPARRGRPALATA